MQNNISVIFFIAIWSVCSTVIWFVLWKNKSKNIEKMDVIKTVFFYFAVYYGIMTMVKLLLGNAEETLFESFWNAQVRTYVHYGIPMAILSIAIPFALKMIFKDKGLTIISIMDAVLFAELVVVFVCGIRLENVVCGTLFAIAGIVSIAYAVIRKDVNECIEKKDISFGICAWGLWIVLTVISIPNELYLTNISEFPISYGRFFASVLIGGVVIGIIGIVGSVIFLTPGIYKFVTLFLFGISVMGYVQSLLLNGQLSAMDGEVQVWPMWQQVSNLLIWIVAIIILAYLYYRKNKKGISKGYKVIAIYIMAVQVVSLIVLVLSTDISTQKVDEALTTQGALDISKGENVIVFVLDRFDGETMDEILLEDSEFVDPLKDFTYYENATCQFARTSMAVPYLLTGTEWQVGMTEEEYPPYAYQNSNVLHDIVQNGYRVGIYSDMSFVDDSVKEYISNYSDKVERKCNTYGTIKIMTQCAKYRMAPFVIKANYSYYTRDIVENIADSEDVWNVDNDILFYEMLEQRGISFKEEVNEAGAFLFYHMYGAHPPFRMTEDLRAVDDWESSMISQAKGSLKIVYRYIEQMKELGKYDESTIIIIADHGIQMGSNEGDNPIPLILVKEAGKGQEALQISSAPVSQEEFVPTILEAMGLDRSMYGRTYAEVPVGEVQERVHANVWGDEIDTYVIKGDAKNPANWYQISE